jgi:hypothetical protein
MMTASNQGSTWLFPGYRPGQPLHPGHLMSKHAEDAGRTWVTYAAYRSPRRAQENS